jgi:hypothetical protein
MFVACLCEAGGLHTYKRVTRMPSTADLCNGLPEAPGKVFLKGYSTSFKIASISGVGGVPRSIAA